MRVAGEGCSREDDGKTLLERLLDRLTKRRPKRLMKALMKRLLKSLRKSTEESPRPKGADRRVEEYDRVECCENVAMMRTQADVAQSHCL